jgi:prephenate dehydratase
MSPSAQPEAPVQGGAGATSGARAGYLGPRGTFSEEALLSSAVADAVAPVALPGIYETVMALQKGELEWAVVPIENSLEGSINVTLDLLAGQADGVEIVGETVLRVNHSLIAAEPMALAQIETVLTHPQVPGQCAALLHGELAHARVLPASSTAEAVRTVTERRRHGQAALGTVLAARIYGGTVIREGVQDREDNETRFVWLGPRGAGHAPPLRAADRTSPPPWKTSLVFWGLGAERPGWLVRCLDEFARRAINLTKIESRPRRDQLGSYMFFVDLAGAAEQTPVAEAIAGLRALCEQVRVLGSYRDAGRSFDPDASANG